MRRSIVFYKRFLVGEVSLFFEGIIVGGVCGVGFGF